MEGAPSEASHHHTKLILYITFFQRFLSIGISEKQLDEIQFDLRHRFIFYRCFVLLFLRFLLVFERYSPFMRRVYCRILPQTDPVPCSFFRLFSRTAEGATAGAAAGTRNECASRTTRERSSASWPSARASTSARRTPCINRLRYRLVLLLCNSLDFLAAGVSNNCSR